MRLPLPIDDVLPDVIAALRRHASLVVRAPTGAGKTSRIPPALLDAGLPERGRILLLEPRRLAARAAAGRMAQERGGQLGAEIGYHVRFDRRFGPTTRILAATPGILLRMLHGDPYFESVGAVLFDEFHERSLDNDLALGMVHLIQQTVRPDLRILVMSATLEVERVSTYLDQCPIVSSEGRLHPVKIHYEPPPGGHRPSTADVARAVARLLNETSGDVLVFLPGLYEIRQSAHQLADLAAARDLSVVALHGDLPAEQQDAALLAQSRRKVVLATNVAETSVTVEGITGVVDTGLARVLELDTGLGLDRLRTVPVSRSSADQRAGRAGRMRPGVCLRLWSESSQRARPAQTEPEVLRVDLAGAVLQLMCLGETDMLRFPWLEPPRSEAVFQAQALLQRLGGINRDGVTELGQTLARLPVHPRLGRLLIEGQRLGEPKRTALAAALLSERDPFVRGTQPAAGAAHLRSHSDVLDRVEALEEFERSGQCATSLGSLHRGAARFVLQARNQLLHSLRDDSNVPSQRKSNEPNSTTADEAVLRSLLAAFPDRVARRREPGSRRGVMVGGRGVLLAPSCHVADAQLFVCVDVDAGQSEALVRQASAIEREWLPMDRVTTGVEVTFDAATQKVTARRRQRFEDLLLEESPAPLPEGEETAQVLAAAAAQQLECVLPPPDSAAAGFLLRWRCLRQWRPELGLPALDEAELRELLPWLCARCRSFADLRQADWLGALQGRLNHAQRLAIDREAPEKLQVPSGSQITLRYELGRPPVLAVRIQELFGLRETPHIAGGRVPVLLHLLAPNYRPQQVTDDLASFWANTYLQVRKELRARYPKHAWPEDPLSASPERRPRRKSQGQ